MGSNKSMKLYKTQYNILMLKDEWAVPFRNINLGVDFFKIISLTEIDRNFKLNILYSDSIDELYYVFPQTHRYTDVMGKSVPKDAKRIKTITVGELLDMYMVISL